MLKKVFAVFFTLLLVLSAGGTLFSTNANAADETVEIILHKHITRDVTAHELEEYQNTGLPIEESDWENIDVVSKATPLNGANFTVYDVTDYYEQIKKTPESFVKYFAEMKRSELYDLIEKKELTPVKGSPIKTKQDDDFGAGTARITLPRFNDNRDAVYLIVENALDPEKGFNIDLEKKAIPLAVVLPILNPKDETKELQQIHIYPKNIGYLRDPYFFKYGAVKGEEDKAIPLEGAQFVLFRYNENNEKLYLDMSPASDLKNKWVGTNDPLNDPNVNKFTSDKDGLVDMGERFLPSGTYYFEEVKSVDGYEIETSNKKIEVVIPDSWEDKDGNPLYVTVNGQIMDELVSGKVPQSAYDKAEPRVYNYTDGKTTESDPPGTSEEKPETPQKPQDPPKKQGGLLPNTGEAKAMISLFGIMLIAFVFYAKKRKKA